LLLRSLHFGSTFFFLEVRVLPLIDFGDRMIDRRERLFMLDRTDPFLDSRLIGASQLIEIQSILLHSTPLRLAPRASSPAREDQGQVLLGARRQSAGRPIATGPLSREARYGRPTKAVYKEIIFTNVTRHYLPGLSGGCRRRAAPARSGAVLVSPNSTALGARGAGGDGLWRLRSRRLRSVGSKLIDLVRQVADSPIRYAVCLARGNGYNSII